MRIRQASIQTNFLHPEGRGFSAKAEIARLTRLLIGLSSLAICTAA
jgi:hypothetical protein